MSARSVVCVLLCVLWACQTTKPSRDADDVILGAPPSRQEDPFHAMELPKNAVAAPTSGTVGNVTAPAKPAVEKPVAEKPVVEKPAPQDTPKVASKGVAVRANPPERVPEQYQCFSCVKICTTKDPTSDCSRSKEDMICGWGTSASIEESMRAARGQCDAALNMARQMPQWSEIEGGCPVASCR